MKNRKTNFCDSQFIHISRNLTSACRGWLLLIYVCWFNPLIATSSPKIEYQVESIGKLAGLNSSDIQALYQDEDGYIWIGNRPGVSRFDGYSFQNFTQAENQFLGSIHSIVEDGQGTIWIGGTNGLFFWEKGQFRAANIPPKKIRALHVGKQGELWVGGLGFVPFALSQEALESLGDGQTVDISPIETRVEWEKKIGGFRVWALDVDLNGTVWFGLDDRHASFDGEEVQVYWKDSTVLHQYVAIAAFHQDSVFWGSEKTPTLFQKNGQISVVPETASNSPTYIITKTDSATYFLTTDYLMELREGKWTTLHTFDDFASLYCKNMMLDREGNFWIGAVGDLIKLTPVSFSTISFADNPLLDSNHFIEETSSGAIMIGSNGGQVHRYSDNSVALELQLNVPSNSIVSDIFEETDGFWFATSTGGLIHLKDGQQKQYTTEQGLGDNGQYFLFRDNSGNLWSGGDGGISKVNRDVEGGVTFDNYVAAYPGFDIDFPVLTDMFEGPEQSLWAISDKGLYRVEKNDLIHWTFPAGLNPNPILTAVQKHENQVWLTTQGEGLWQCEFKPDGELQVVYRWTEKDGLLSDVLFDLHRDKLGRMWVVSQGGICHINLRDNAPEFECFDKRDGWIEDASAHFYLLESRDSLLWAISKTSVINFPLYDFLVNNVSPKAFINKVELLNEEDNIYDYSSNPIEKQLLPQNLVLPYNKNFLRFYCSTTSHTRVDKNKFRFQLEGLDQGWSEPSGNRDVLYSGLRPGVYTFHLMAANNDGLWGEKTSYSFRILSPIWWRWWAILSYMLLLGWGTFKLYRFQLARQLTLVENKRLRELDQVKTNLYTNITHEFRTPLTVILGMTQQIRKEVKKATLPKLQIIQRNSQQLFELINQMLDLSKLESGQMSLDLIQSDIVSYIRYLSRSFVSYADQKEIALEYNPGREQLIMDFDPKVIQQILSNLLSNALKFTSAGGEIRIELIVDGDDLEIQVSDTGEGISQEHLELIFDRFQQLDSGSTKKHEGTGIGLALVKEWIEHLDGEILVQSELGKGTTFLLKLPITRNAKMAEFPMSQRIVRDDPYLLPTNHSANSLDLPLVLLIEDNVDVAHYLRLALQHRYQCIHAENGRIGVEVTWDRIPDLIICDVMMPEMDGYEVCRLLKKDERSNHIPIIMLTARVDYQDRITGLSEGADAYLAKPFAEEELLIRMDKLLELRRELQQKYSQELITLPSSPESAKSLQDPFLEKVEQAILARLNDENFSSDELARTLFLSRSQLHRKIKALTGKSTSIYLRLIRLREAQKLLANSALTISEIAFQVGFKSPVYFSQIYKETFGGSPSEQRK